MAAVGAAVGAVVGLAMRGEAIGGMGYCLRRAGRLTAIAIPFVLSLSKDPSILSLSKGLSPSKDPIILSPPKDPSILSWLKGPSVSMDSFSLPRQPLSQRSA